MTANQITIKYKCGHTSSYTSRGDAITPDSLKMLCEVCQYQQLIEATRGELKSSLAEANEDINDTLGGMVANMQSKIAADFERLKLDTILNLDDMETQMALAFAKLDKLVKSMENEADESACVVVEYVKDTIL